MNAEMETEFFARLEPPGVNPYEPERKLIDGNGNVVGVAVPSAASPGSLMVCLDKELVAKLRNA